MQKRAVQFAKKPCLPLFSSETADKLARDYTIEKSFRHALHLVTAHLHRQNQVAHALRTRDFWLASLSMHFPIHFTPRAHEYPVTLIELMSAQINLATQNQVNSYTALSSTYDYSFTSHHRGFHLQDKKWSKVWNIDSSSMCT